MANAKIETKQVPLTTYVEKKTVTLEMTVEEAQVIRALAGCISGRSEFRDLADSVFWALDRAEIKSARVRLSTGKSLYINGDFAVIDGQR